MYTCCDNLVISQNRYTHSTQRSVIACSNHFLYTPDGVVPLSFVPTGIFVPGVVHRLPMLLHVQMLHFSQAGELEECSLVCVATGALVLELLWVVEGDLEDLFKVLGLCGVFGASFCTSVWRTSAMMLFEGFLYVRYCCSRWMCVAFLRL
jgi:hypothetical protein